MNKRIKKNFTIVLSIGIITVSSIGRNSKIGYSYNKEDSRNTNLYDKAQEIPSKRNEKVAYITIDDGPSKYTESIIKILNKYKEVLKNL